MAPHDDRKPKTEPRPEQKRDPPERTSAPPIEREHETYKGIFEEDENREKQRR